LRVDTDFSMNTEGKHNGEAHDNRLEPESSSDVLCHQCTPTWQVSVMLAKDSTGFGRCGVCMDGAASLH